MLRFRLGSVPVRVHLSFLILGFFGWTRFGDYGLEYAAVWTLGVFFAILAHEAGHAFTARAFGAQGVSIMLFAFGGATTFPLNAITTPGKRFFVSAAGSAVGIVSGAALALFGQSQGWFDIGFGFPPITNARLDLVVVTAFGFIEAALFWGILNWLPMRPLDGGQMVQSLLELTVPSAAEAATKIVSLAVGIPVIIWGLANQMLFLVFIVGFLLLTGLRTPPKPVPQPAPGQSGGDGQRPEVVDEPPAPAPPQQQPRTKEPPSDFPI